jgi:8-oxo-dGTP pyrophosphatase MutT (NUDIX family)
LWPEGKQRGLPTGYAKAGETFHETIVREVREETGLNVAVGDLARLRSGYKLRVEVAYDALYTGADLNLSPLKILDPAADLLALNESAGRPLTTAISRWHMAAIIPHRGRT